MITDADADAGIAAALADRGFAVARQWLPEDLVAALRATAATRAAAGEFRAARVGRGDVAARIERVRGDLIRWLEPDDPDPAVRAATARLELLRQCLNRALFLGLERLELHFALYPEGAFYARHVDRFRDDDARAVSVVLYLNDDWGEADGGALRLCDARETIAEVQPEGGTLAVFLSDRIPHEVLPARRMRYSLTGWFRRREAP